MKKSVMSERDEWDQPGECEIGLWTKARGLECENDAGNHILTFVPEYHWDMLRHSHISRAIQQTIPICDAHYEWVLKEFPGDVATSFYDLIKHPDKLYVE